MWATEQDFQGHLFSNSLKFCGENREVMNEVTTKCEYNIDWEAHW